MRRLEELLRQMCQAAKAIGNTDLENKFAGGMYVHKNLATSGIDNWKWLVLILSLDT